MTDFKKIEILEKEIKDLQKENAELRKQTADAVVKQYTDEHKKIIAELNELKEMAEKELKDAYDKKKRYEEELKQIQKETEWNRKRQSKFILFGRK